MKRRLRNLETLEAKSIFGTSLDFGRIWVHEEVAFPNLIGRVGAKIKGHTPPSNNAVTLGNHLYFPIRLQIDQEKIERAEFKDMGWLMHELTHAWQFQNTGIGYLFKAILGHLRLGAKVYDYGGKEGLKKSVQSGVGFGSFNPEQQGDIVRLLYLATKRGELSPTLEVIADQVKNPSK